KRWGILSRNQVPARGLLFSVACLVPSLAILYAGASVIDAFTLITTVSSVLFMVVWSLILAAYLVFRCKFPARHAASKFKVPGGAFMCRVVLAFFALLVVVLP